MKKLIFLLAAVLITGAFQAQTLSEDAPTSLEGENIYLVLNDTKLCQQVVELCAKKFAGGNLIILPANDYYRQTTSGDGYVLTPVKEKVGDKYNYWLRLCKAGPKAVIKKPDARGVFNQDPVLKRVASYLIDIDRINTPYAALYVKSLESILTNFRDVSEEQRETMYSSSSQLEKIETLLLCEDDMKAEFNQPKKIREIHPTASIMSSKDIDDRIRLMVPGMGFVETTVQHLPKDEIIEYIRVNKGNGELALYKIIYTKEGEGLINREILESLRTEANIEKGAGKK